jgi:O-antigen/teichoic acid export membrane protein
MSNLTADSPPTVTLPTVRSLRSNVQWTLLGYFAYGVCQWLMLIVVARMGLPEMVGQFALAMAVTTPIILLLGLDLRTVQATDQSNHYPFEDFFILRIATLSLAMIVIMGFAAWSGYKSETSLLIFVMGVAKCIEAMSDLCHGTLQQHERLDQMSKSRMLRGALSVVVLAGGLYASGSLLIATISLAVMWGIFLVVYDWPITSQLLRSTGQSVNLLRFRPRRVWALLVPAIPTGILNCQSSLEQTLPRLCVDGYLGERELGMYSAVSSLIIASTMVINAVHCAVLPRIARHLTNNQWKQTWGMLLKLSLFGGLIGAAGMAVVHFCGNLLLGVAFGAEYASQSPLLVVLMAGAMVRYSTLSFSTGFRAARKFWLLSILQTISLLVSVPVLMLLVRTHGGMGAAFSSVALALLIAVIQIPAAICLLRRPSDPRQSDCPVLELPAETEMRGAA